jgi:hypothetical protein
MEGQRLGGDRPTISGAMMPHDSVRLAEVFNCQVVRKQSMYPVRYMIGHVVENVIGDGT